MLKVRLRQGRCLVLSRGGVELARVINRNRDHTLWIEAPRDIDIVREPAQPAATGPGPGHAKKGGPGDAPNDHESALG